MPHRIGLESLGLIQSPGLHVTHEHVQCEHAIASLPCPPLACGQQRCAYASPTRPRRDDQVSHMSAPPAIVILLLGQVDEPHWLPNRVLGNQHSGARRSPLECFADYPHVDNGHRSHVPPGRRRVEANQFGNKPENEFPVIGPRPTDPHAGYVDSPCPLSFHATTSGPRFSLSTEIFTLSAYQTTRSRHLSCEGRVQFL